MAGGKTYPDETKACIYGLRAIDTSIYFYIGSTKHRPDSRLESHLYDVKNGYHKNRHFVNKVNKIGIDRVTCDTLEIVNLYDRWQAEMQWIDRLSSEGHKLVNRIHNEIEFSVIDYRNFRLSRDRYLQICEFVKQPPPKSSGIIPQNLLDNLHEELRLSLSFDRAIGLDKVFLGEVEWPS